jgi:hypothetical protein
MPRTAVGIRNILALFACVGLGACSTTIRETHYFQTQTTPQSLPNYYRLSIEASSVMSSSRYLSGYFDEDVVNQYFNEIKQPDAARLIPLAQSGTSAPNSTTAAANAATNVLIKKTPSLVLLMSTNSDDIANQLGALSQSQEFTDSLARILAPRRFAAATDSERSLAIEQSQGKSLVAIGEQLTSDLVKDESPEANQIRLLNFVNQMLSDFGAPRFNDLPAASAWLTANRASVVKGGS